MKKINHFGDWKNYPYSNWLYQQGIKPDYSIDKDQDGIVDWEDCDPFDKYEQGLWSTIREKASQAVQKVKETVSKGVEKAKDVASSVSQKVSSGVSSVKQSISSAVQRGTTNVISNINKVSSGISSVKQTASDMYQKADTALQGYLPGSVTPTQVKDDALAKQQELLKSKAATQTNQYLSQEEIKNIISSPITGVDLFQRSIDEKPFERLGYVFNYGKPTIEQDDLKKFVSDDTQQQSVQQSFVPPKQPTYWQETKEVINPDTGKKEYILPSGVRVKPQDEEGIRITEELIKVGYTGADVAQAYLDEVRANFYEKKAAREQKEKEESWQSSVFTPVIEWFAESRRNVGSEKEMFSYRDDVLANRMTSISTPTLGDVPFETQVAMMNAGFQPDYSKVKIPKISLASINPALQVYYKDKYSLSDKDLQRSDLYVFDGKVYDRYTIDEAIKNAKRKETAAQFLAAGVGLTAGWTGIGIPLAMGIGAAATAETTAERVALEKYRDQEAVNWGDVYEVGKEGVMGALLAMPVTLPSGAAAKGVKGAFNIAFSTYANWEKIAYPLTTSGVSPKIREQFDKWENKQINQMNEKEKLWQKSIDFTQAGITGGVGRLLFPKDKSEATQDLVIGSFLAAESKIIAPLQKAFLYGYAPVAGVKGLIDAEKPSDYFVSSVALIPVTAAVGGKLVSKFSRLKIDDVIPGLVREDVRGVRVTADLEFKMDDGTTKHLIYNKKSGSIETPGGGTPKDISKNELSLRDVLATARREIKEETGMKIDIKDLELVDIVNSPIETQFTVRLKKPLPASEVPTKITKEAKKEEILKYSLIDRISAYNKNLKESPYVSPMYEGNRYIAWVKKQLEFTPTGYMRQQDIIAFKRAEAIEGYNKLSDAKKAELAKQGETYLEKKFGKQEVNRLKQEQVFPIDFGKEYYLIKKGLGEKILRAKLDEFKIDYQEPTTREIITRRGKKYEVKRTDRWSVLDNILDRKPGAFKKGALTLVSDIKARLASNYESMGELGKLQLGELAKDFYIKNFGAKKYSQLQNTKIDLGLRYYLLQNGIGTKVELSRLSLASKTQLSPYDISKMEIITTRGKESAVVRDQLGRFQKNIARSRINQEMSMVYLPHSRYRGTSSEIAKLISNDYFTGTSLSPNQIKTVGDLVKDGTAEKLGIDLTKANSWDIVVLSKDQKKLLTGKGARGEDVLFFTPPTSAGIKGESAAALSYAGIGGIIDYSGPRVYLDPTRPTATLTKSQIQALSETDSLGVTYKGSPFRKATVTEVEFGLASGGRFTYQDVPSAKVRFGRKVLEVRKAEIQDNQIKNIDIRINNIKYQIEQLLMLRRNKNILPIQQKDIDIQLRRVQDQIKELNNLKKRVKSQKEIASEYMGVQDYQLVSPFRDVGYYTPSKDKKQEYEIPKEYSKIMDYRIAQDYQIPKEYATPSDYKTPTEYKIASDYKLPQDYKIPSDYKLPGDYRTPSDYKTPSEYKPPRDIQIPEEYKNILIPPIREKERYDQKSRLRKPGYYAFGKVVRTNKFAKINEQPVTKERAMDIGSYYVSNTLAKTYKIVKANKYAEQDFQFPFIPEGYYKTVAMKLREFKIRKGQPVDFGRQFIEKRKYGLETVGEKAQIQKFRREVEQMNKGLVRP